MRAFLFLAAALAAVVSPGVTSVTHREATNIVKSVAYTKDEADGRYLTTNLVGKTVVTGTNTVLKMGAGTRVNGTDDMYIQLGGGELIFPDNLGITVRGNRTLATWGITNGYTKTETDQRIEELAPPFELTSLKVYERILALDGTSKSEVLAALLNAYGNGLIRNAPQVAQGVDGLFLVSGEGDSSDSSGGGIGGSFILYGENGGSTGGRTVSSIGGGAVLPGTRPGTGGRITPGSGGVSTSEVSRVYLGFGMSGPDVPGVFPGKMYTDAAWLFEGEVAFLPGKVYLLDEATMTDMTLEEWVVEGIEATMTPAKLVSLVQAMTDAQKTAFKTALGIQ